MEGWTTESVLKKHNLWRELAGPLAGPTAITLQWQDMRIAKLEAALRALADEVGVAAAHGIVLAINNGALMNAVEVLAGSRSQSDAAAEPSAIPGGLDVPPMESSRGFPTVAIIPHSRRV